jgi:2-keto-4-pentenoate hydratase/2-oxohepta-3-ene-1,7-dioic acid hydratase in catechol pathway
MKIASFVHQGAASWGIVSDDGASLLNLAVLPGQPASVRELLEMGELALEAAIAAKPQAPEISLAAVQLLSPVPNPRKILALGVNYSSHVAEMQARNPAYVPPQVQVWFNKQATCIAGPFDEIHLPKVSTRLDYEGELVFVVGRRCRRAQGEDAASAIAGFAVGNDVSVRDWQMASPTWTIGKSFDTHGPVGPWLVTADDIPDPGNLRIRTYVGGEIRQDFSTSDMIHSCAAMVEHLSKVMTLEPGDIIFTGTGTGVGALRNPPTFLKEQDVVRIEIEGIGHIENRVVAEPEDWVFERRSLAKPSMQSVLTS